MSEVPLAVPKIFNLGAIKPPGINAYTRKVQSISTNNTTFTKNMNAQQQLLGLFWIHQKVYCNLILQLQIPTPTLIMSISQHVE